MSFVPPHPSSSCSVLFTALEGACPSHFNSFNSFHPPSLFFLKKRFQRFCLSCIFACPGPQLSLNFESLSSPHATRVSATPCLCFFQIKNVRTAHTSTEGWKERSLVSSFCCLCHCLCVKIEMERFYVCVADWSL